MNTMNRTAHRRKAADEYSRALGALQRAWEHDRQADDLGDLDRSLGRQDRQAAARAAIESLLSESITV